MSNTYTPPGYLDFEEFFEKVSFAYGFDIIFLQPLRATLGGVHNNDDFNTTFDRYITHIKCKDIEKIEAFLLEDSKRIFLSIAIEIGVDNEQYDVFFVDNKKLDISKTKEGISLSIDKMSLIVFPFFSNKSEAILWTKHDLETMINIAKVQNCVRDALCNSSISSFILDDTTKYSLKADTWINSEYWFRMLRRSNNVWFPSQCIACSDESARGRGKILFKNDEVITLCDSLVDKRQINNSNEMFFHITPWIEIMSHFSLMYGETILTASKDALEIEMKEYIEKNNLNIPKSDIPYMAKFIRTPEQREGTIYHSKQKKTKVG